MIIVYLHNSVSLVFGEQPGGHLYQHWAMQQHLACRMHSDHKDTISYTMQMVS